MARLRLRTQLLIATLLIICALLGALFLCVRRTVRSEIAEGVRQSTNASLNAFENVQQEHEMDLSQTAASFHQGRWKDGREETGLRDPGAHVLLPIEKH